MASLSCERQDAPDSCADRPIRRSALLSISSLLRRSTRDTSALMTFIILQSDQSEIYASAHMTLHVYLLSYIIHNVVYYTSI